MLYTDIDVADGDSVARLANELGDTPLMDRGTTMAIARRKQQSIKSA